MEQPVPIYGLIEVAKLEAKDSSFAGGSTQGANHSHRILISPEARVSLERSLRGASNSRKMPQPKLLTKLAPRRMTLPGEMQVRSA
jgi:hypothetical protein